MPMCIGLIMISCILYMYGIIPRKDSGKSEDSIRYLQMAHKEPPDKSEYQMEILYKLRIIYMLDFIVDACIYCILS